MGTGRFVYVRNRSFLPLRDILMKVVRNSFKRINLKVHKAVFCDANIRNLPGIPCTLASSLSKVAAF